MLFQSPSRTLGRAAKAARPRALWVRRCGPILSFLATPRTNDQLLDWASERAMSRSRLEEMLVWLQTDGQLDTPTGDTWTRI